MRKLLLGTALVVTLAEGTGYGLAQTGQKTEGAATPVTVMLATPGVSTEQAATANLDACASPAAAPVV
jgi:hypothetical protein